MPNEAFGGLMRGVFDSGRNGKGGIGESRPCVRNRLDGGQGAVFIAAGSPSGFDRRGWGPRRWTLCPQV
jgi:hypothetical protein